MPPLHYTPQYPLPSQLPVYLQSAGQDGAVDKQSAPAAHSICGGNTGAQTLKFASPLTVDHVLFVVAVIVAVRGPVVDVEALDRSVVVTRGDILDGDGKKDYVRLQQSGGQLLYKERKFSSN